MKILLDNCVHVKVKSFFTAHEVYHARDMRWRDLANGRLLAAAAAEQFDAMVTVDKNIRHQHDLEELNIAIVEINTRFTRLDDLRKVVPYLDDALKATKGYVFVSVADDGTIERIAPRRR